MCCPRTCSRARRPSTGPRDDRSTATPGGSARIWPFLGPAFIAAVAYIDPGNFATNIAGGAKFGYLLLWVVLGANLIAMVVQTQSAKLGIATGRNLAEACRDSFSRRTSIGLWIQAEIVAAACDIAEVVGAALGLNLLFGIPLFPAGLLAGAGRVRDPRPAAEGLPPARGGHRRDGRRRRRGLRVRGLRVESGWRRRSSMAMFVPGFDGTESILLATGIIGATVMPHVIYLHSALTQRRIVGRDERGASQDPALRADRRRHRDGARRRREPLDDDHGRRPLPRQRPGRDRQHRRCLRRPQAGRLSQRSDDLRHRSAGVRLRLVVRGDDVRPGRDAGVHPPADPDLRCAGRSRSRRP